ncbi:hypothetical protein [Kangiella sp.]|uniref:hypothetical protein n=1 Tax=Kangiella sp. TaxID=1920245 RepID=UPI0019CC65A5|nr:hypothetical protein [Kangiella sp.]MBD3653371.1 hypothetical protein [Kangiella sp.]
MKKTLVLLFGLFTAFLLLFWLKGEPDIQTAQFDPASQVTPPQTTDVANTQSEPVVETVSANDEAVNSEKTQTKPPSNVCKEQLSEQYPELDKQFNQTIQDFYLSEDELAGEGAYQGMPFETLKVLADSNDSKAMIIYGSEKIWYSALGVRISGPDSRYRSSQQTKDIVNNHKVDLDGINEGESYLYNAAVFGKVGAIFEMTLLLDMAAKRLDAKSGDQAVIQELIAKSLAYEKLQLDIHQSDPALKSMFLDSVSWRNSIQRLYADREDYAEIRKQIESDAEKIYQELKERWEHDREYYGFEIYPDYLKGELEEYGNAFLNCHLQ